MKLAQIRDQFWNYPEYIFLGKSSLASRFKDFYLGARPFSIIITTIIISVLFVSIVVTNTPTIFSYNTSEFTEGKIVEVGPGGTFRGAERLNPLEVNIPQLDQDIIEIVYEPLIRINQAGEIETVLAESYSLTEVNRAPTYRFSLRRDVKWHDGEDFTTDDVRATFELIKELSSNGLENIYGGEAAQNVSLEVLDDYICVFTVEGQTLPNFYELMTFKIVPAHLIDQYRDAIVATGSSQSLRTIGTGPFRLGNVRPDEVLLDANQDYYLGKPKLNKFRFKLFSSEREAANALRSGQIHGLANPSSDLVTSVRDLQNLQIITSNVLYNQYFAIYFNFDEEGPAQTKDKKVRQAFSAAINRRLLVETVYEKAEPAYGPIPPISDFHSPDNQQLGYDKDTANKLLDEAGWEATINSEGTRVRVKDGIELRLSLRYIDSSDREKIVSSIISDLAEVGIVIEPTPVILQEQLYGDYLDNPVPELMFLGVNTFIDPDRYEFFHSSQSRSRDNGLNFSGYSSERTTVVIDPVERRPVRIPLVDQLLDDARKTSNVDDRTRYYNTFQEVIADEVPVIFINYPTLRYAINNRVKGVEFTDIKSYVERFKKVYQWEISYQ